VGGAGDSDSEAPTFVTHSSRRARNNKEQQPMQNHAPLPDWQAIREVVKQLEKSLASNERAVGRFDQYMNLIGSVLAELSRLGANPVFAAAAEGLLDLCEELKSELEKGLTKAEKAAEALDDAIENLEGVIDGSGWTDPRRIFELRSVSVNLRRAGHECNEVVINDKPYHCGPMMAETVLALIEDEGLSHDDFVSFKSREDLVDVLGVREGTVISRVSCLRKFLGERLLPVSVVETHPVSGAYRIRIRPRRLNGDREI
jgi:hypothetical protein